MEDEVLEFLTQTIKKTTKLDYPSSAWLGYWPISLAKQKTFLAGNDRNSDFSQELQN